ncbi:hypothetical protein EUX98_g6706 [Antrodiella citrinella]|uniref:MYST-type HAT domain-containing protein n=1 Tax=Antrodiella citrinella TaxID=2447956 RepID=A0A4S4MQ46_9APHY|nr:hypothetical protein EUX98_g6706 [Antrodiella citrinella]
MPQIFHIPDIEPEVYIVNKNGSDQFALVLEKRPSECYVHYHNTDKRMDEWVPESVVRVAGPDERPEAEPSSSRKRKRASVDPEMGGSRGVSEDRSSVLRDGSAATPGESGAGTTITEEEYDIEHHKLITAKRNFDKVAFGKWQIKTWYFSPYPLIETETEDASTPTSSGQAPTGRIPGVARSTVRSHGRTSDLFAGGLGRSHGAMLWVCDRCFKYMAEGISWELHVKKCARKHPPGRKVYQRGAHIIWEVDGAKDKEKISYDDYNLACIVVLPPYQKKGYGMLMIEFSYELSRRAGKIGTPERPLSDLGLRSYLTYWTSTLIRFFRYVLPIPALRAPKTEFEIRWSERSRLLSVLPADTPQLVTVGTNPFSPSHSSSVYNGNGVDPTPDSLASPESDETNGVGSGSRMKRRKSTKGWDGEVQAGRSELEERMMSLDDDSDPVFSTLRTIETTANLDGSASSHVVVNCALSDIARATGLRVEDAAFALNECGLLTRRRTQKDEDGEEEIVIVLTREMVEVVAEERNVKIMCMDLAHVLL